MKIHNKHGEVIDHAFHPTERDDVLVVVAHGVTGDMDRPLVVELTNRLVAAGWPCLRISFSGCGNSEGSYEDMCVSKEVDDLHSVLDQVKGSKKVAYIGHSMGGAVAALAAAKDDRIGVLVSLAGMVDTKKFCETEFGDQVPGVGCMWDDESLPLSQTYVDDLHGIGNTLTAARDIRSPWLILHGDQDDVVLPKDSEDLFLTLRGKKKHVVIEGADHCFEGFYDPLAEEVDQWLSSYLK